VGFTDDGFRIHSHPNPIWDPNWKYPPKTWALADTSKTSPGTDGDPSFTLLYGDRFVVFTTSPGWNKGSLWVTETGALTENMNPFSEKEVKAYKYDDALLSFLFTSEA
jgi:hypothetical protein